MNLQEMKVAELREIAKGLNMVGAWKAKKAELIEFIEENKQDEVKENESDYVESTQAQITEHEIEEEKPKPVRKPRGEQKKLNLLDADNNIVETFENRKEATTYCMEQGVCNQGWIGVAINEGRAMYYTKDMKPTKAQKKTNYFGQGYKLLYAIN